MNEKDLIKKTVKRYLIPSILLMAALTASSMVNALFASRFFGEAGLQTLRIVYPLTAFVSMAALLIGSGGGILMGILTGKNKKEEVNVVFSTCAASGTVISVCVSVFLLYYLDPMVSLLGAGFKGEAYVREYLFTYIPGVPMIILTSILLIFFQRDSDPDIPLQTTLAMTVVNLFAASVFESIFSMGMSGLGLASTLSYLSGMIVVLLHFKKRCNTLKFSFKDSIKWPVMKQVLKLSLPKTFFNGANVVRLWFFNMTMLTFDLKGVLSAYSVLAYISMLSAPFIYSTETAMAPLIGIFHGEEDKEALKDTLKIGLRWAALMSGAVMILLMFSSNVFIKIFKLTDSSAIEQLRSALFWFLLSLPLSAIVQILVSALSNCAKSRPAYIISIINELVVPVIVISLLIGKIGATAIWLTWITTELVTLIILFVYFSIKNRKPAVRLSDLASYPEPYQGELLISAECREDFDKVKERIFAFCIEHGCSDKQAGDAVFFAERISSCIFEASQVQTKGYLFLIKVILNDNRVMLKFRDNGKKYDLCIPEHLNIGADQDLKNVKMAAASVNYRYSVGMNNVIVKMQ